MYPLISG